MPFYKLRTKIAVAKKYGLRFFFVKDEEFYIFEGIYNFLRKKVVYIHIPKTGGISIYKQIFGLNSVGHFTYKEMLAKKYKTGELTTFPLIAFVRNPIDRFVSAYNYLIQGGRLTDLDLNYKHKLAQYSSINDFVQNGLKTSYMEYEHFVPQHIWIENTNGEVASDYIINLENPLEKIAAFSKLTGIAIDMSMKKNVTIQKKEQLDDKSLEIIKDLYKKDFQMFYPDFEL